MTIAHRRKGAERVETYKTRFKMSYFLITKKQKYIKNSQTQTLSHV